MSLSFLFNHHFLGGVYQGPIVDFRNIENIHLAQYIMGLKSVNAVELKCAIICNIANIGIAMFSSIK